MSGMTDVVILTGDVAVIIDVQDVATSCLERKIPDAV